MYYLIYSEDVDNSLPLRKQARPDHIARLNTLNDEGRLLVAGPCPAIEDVMPATKTNIGVRMDITES